MKSLLLIFFIFCAGKIFSQDTLSYDTFNEAQYKAWKTIEQLWLTEKYYPFLKKEKIKLSCASCTSASAWVVMQKNATGTTFKILKNNKCGQPFQGKQLAAFRKLIAEIKLPDEFNDTQIKVLLGLALKC